MEENIDINKKINKENHYFDNKNEEKVIKGDGSLDELIEALKNYIAMLKYKYKYEEKPTEEQQLELEKLELYLKELEIKHNKQKYQPYSPTDPEIPEIVYPPRPRPRHIM